MLIVVAVLLQPARVSAVDATITYFNPASGTYLLGDAVTSGVRVMNTGSVAWTFWIDYSVRDEAGIWYNVAPSPVTVTPGAESPVQNETWQVPTSPPVMNGNFTVAMAVWSSPPENYTATKLAYVEQSNSFRVLNLLDQFSRFDSGQWYKSNYRAGRGMVSSSNVDVANGTLFIKIPANTYDGGEVGSQAAYLYGTYRALIKCPKIAGSMCAFYLFQPTGGANADEVDIEIPIGRGVVYLTTWLKGAHANCADPPQTPRCPYANDPPIPLTFDPSADFHEYRIDLYPGAVSFYIDGALVKTWTSGIPTHPMLIIVSASMPAWMSGTQPTTDQYMYIRWIQH